MAQTKKVFSCSHPTFSIVQSTAVEIQNTGSEKERERSDSKKGPWMSRNFDNLRRTCATCKTISVGSALRQSQLWMSTMWYRHSSMPRVIWTMRRFLSVYWTILSWPDWPDLSSGLRSPASLASTKQATLLQSLCFFLCCCYFGVLRPVLDMSFIISYPWLLLPTDPFK